MIPVVQRAIRKLLHEHPDGLTSRQLTDMVGAHRANVRRALRVMPDVYVDRWARGERNSFEKVWCAVYVPDDCPHPKDMVYRGGRGASIKTKWVNL